MDNGQVYQTRFPLKCLLTCHQRWFRLALMTNGQRPCAVHARTSCSNPSKPAQLATGLVPMLKHGYLMDHMITTWEFSLIYISRMLGAMGNSSSMWPVHEALCATISNLSTKFESSMRNPHKYENPITIQNLWRPLSCEIEGFHQPTTSCVTGTVPSKEMSG